MNNALNYFTEGIQLQESPLKNDLGETIAWYSTASKCGEKGFSAGFSTDKIISRKIAIAEYIERNFVIEAAKNENKSWGFNLVKTGCGFAVGFDKQNTIIRSICEATERWALSKFVDENYYFEKITLQNKSQVQSSLEKHFDKVEYYKNQVIVKVGKDEYLQLNVLMSLAFKNNGVFLGSKCKIDDELIFEHALVESVRHLKIFQNNLSNDIFPFNRIKYFGKNTESAYKVLNSMKPKKMPVANIQFFKFKEIENGIFIARTILSGGTPWIVGGLDRFLY